MRGPSVVTAVLQLFLGVAAAAGPGDPQAPGPEAAPRISDQTTDAATPLVTGTASIAGVVVGSMGQPIAGVEVTLYGRVLARRRLSASTDDQGRFGFRGLPAGRYTVGASKPGFAPVLHGQRRVGAPGRAWRLADGEHRDLRLQLPRLSAITGTVLDDQGDPVGGVSVRLLRSVMSSGYRRESQVRSTTTDGGGRYRLDDLLPGSYAVCASSRETAPLNAAQRLRREIDQLRWKATFVLGPAGVRAQERIAPELAELEARLPEEVDPVWGLGDTCLPPAPGMAPVVTVGVDETRAGVDLRLALTRLARLDGQVVADRPVTLQVGPILLFNADARLHEGTIKNARPDLQGRFVLTDVPPGRYALLLHAADQSRRQQIVAAADVVVDKDDVSNLELVPQPPATIAGQVVFQGTTVPAAETMAAVQVRLDPAGQGAIARHVGPFVAPVDAGARFVLDGVFPGQYRLSAHLQRPAPWFIETATIAGRDVLFQPVTIAAGQHITGVVVTMTDRRAEISGTILDGQGEPVSDYWILAYPSDERDRGWPARRGSYGTRADEDGRFTITGLRAGSYRVATFLHGEFGDWFDPEFVKRLDPIAAPLAIADGERKTLNLRVP